MNRLLSATRRTAGPRPPEASSPAPTGRPARCAASLLNAFDAGAALMQPLAVRFACCTEAQFQAVTAIHTGCRAWAWRRGTGSWWRRGNWYTDERPPEAAVIPETLLARGLAAGSSHRGVHALLHLVQLRQHRVVDVRLCSRQIVVLALISINVIEAPRLRRAPAGLLHCHAACVGGTGVWMDRAGPAGARSKMYK